MASVSNFFFSFFVVFFSNISTWVFFSSHDLAFFFIQFGDKQPMTSIKNEGYVFIQSCQMKCLYMDFFWQTFSKIQCNILTIHSYINVHSSFKSFSYVFTSHTNTFSYENFVKLLGQPWQTKIFDAQIR